MLEAVSGSAMMAESNRWSNSDADSALPRRSSDEGFRAQKALSSAAWILVFSVHSHLSVSSFLPRLTLDFIQVSSDRKTAVLK